MIKIIHLIELCGHFVIYFVILIVICDTETQNRDKVSEYNVEKGQLYVFVNHRSLRRARNRRIASFAFERNVNRRKVRSSLIVAYIFIAWGFDSSQHKESTYRYVKYISKYILDDTYNNSRHLPTKVSLRNQVIDYNIEKIQFIWSIIAI